MLTQNQVIGSVALGSALWGVATYTIGVMNRRGLFEPGVLKANFVIAGAIVAPTTPFLVAKVVGVRGQDLVSAVVLGTAAAAFLDGVAIPFFPFLYGTRNFKDLAAPAAWLLYGVGLLLGSTYVIAGQQ